MVEEKFYLLEANECIPGSYDLMGTKTGLIATFWNRKCYNAKKEAEKLCDKLNKENKGDC